jgi:hypothetical protein
MKLVAEPLLARLDRTYDRFRNADVDDDAIVALASYSRLFRDMRELRLLLVEALREADDSEAERSEAAERVRREAVSTASLLLETATSLDVLAAPLYEGQEELEGITVGSALSLLVAEHDTPLADVSDIAKHMRQLKPGVFDDQAFFDGPARALLTARDELRELKIRLKSVAMVRHFEGARTILSWSRAPDTIGTLDAADLQAYRAGEAIQFALGLGDGVHVQYPLDSPRRAVPAFHEWITDRLMREQATLTVIERFKQRTERFQVAQARVESRKRSVGESNLRRLLVTYMHDAGLDPLIEADLGQSRADILAMGPTRVVVEVKRVTNRGQAKARDDIHSGIVQAAAYARRAFLPVGHLVVFWDADRYEHSIAPRFAFNDVEVDVTIVDLRGTPSARVRRSRPRGRARSRRMAIVSVQPADLGIA